MESLENVSGLIIGMDLNEDVAMLSYYDYNNNIVNQLEFDNRQEYFLNKPLKELVKDVEGVREGEYRELTNLLSSLLDAAANKTGVSVISCLTVVLHNYSIDYLNAIKRVFQNLGLNQANSQVISKGESFAYYAYSQKRELYIGGVCLVDFEENGLKYIRLNSKRSNNVDYIIEDKKIYNSIEFKEVLNKEKNLEDVEDLLISSLNEFLDRKMISSIYLTGAGFNTDKLPENYIKLITSRKKAFIGNNLYSKGACYSALEYIRPKVFDNTVLLSEQRIMVGIELDILDKGVPKRFRLIKPGTNWFMADRSIDFIIEDMREIKLHILTADNRFDDESIDISDFPYREGKTTRISISVKFFSSDRCQIVVKDLGFGDFFKSSGKLVYKDLDFAI